MAFGESVPTVQVVSRKGRKRMEIINEADFDPKKDMLWADYEKAQADEEADEEETTSRRRPPNVPGTPPANRPQQSPEEEGSADMTPAGHPTNPRPPSGPGTTRGADGLQPSKGAAPIDTPTLKPPTTTAGAPEHPPGKMPPSSGSTTPAPKEGTSDKQGDKK